MYYYGLVDYFSRFGGVKPNNYNFLKLILPVYEFYVMSYENLSIMFTTGLYVNIAINMNINHFE